MDVSVVIPSYQTKGFMRDCLASIFSETRGIEYEVIVVDNASTDGTAEMIREQFPQVKLLVNERNVGFGSACNVGIRGGRGRYVLVLNSDTAMRGNTIAALTKVMDREPRAGAVACSVVGPDGSLQVTWGRFPNVRRAIWGSTFSSHLLRNLRRPWGKETCLGEPSETRAVDYLWATCLLLRRSALDQIDLFDENMFMYVEDIDLCFRMKRAGWEVLYTPEAEALHHGGQSSIASASSEEVLGWHFTNIEYFFKKNYGAFHLNLMRLSLILGALLKLPVYGVLSPLLRGRQRGFVERQLRWHTHILRWYGGKILRRLLSHGGATA